MKILHTASRGQDADTARSRPGTRRVRARRDSGGNGRILRHMLDCIVAYRDKRMSLPALISELEFQLQSLIMADHNWQQTFFGRWRDLDHEHMLRLQGDSVAFDKDSMQRIEKALDGLHELISSILAGTDTD